MIEIKTVLILGAGSSYGYKFPLGFELCRLIYQIATSLTNEKELKELNTSKEELVAFYQGFRYSGVVSIDEFLSARTEFIELGKKLIAKVLLPFENEMDLFPPFDDSISEDWYRYLLERMMVDNLEDFSKNKISIITFNYDRSLEQFLYRALMHRFKASSEEISQQLKQINIIHPHGQLGLLPWQNESGDNSFTVHYMGGPTIANIIAASKGIKIIHEANEDTHEFQKAHELINSADRVFILGFGYHKDNLRRLQLRKRIQYQMMLGTVLNMKKEEVGQIIFDSNSVLGQDHLINTSILEFFKEVQRLQ